MNYDKIIELNNVTLQDCCELYNYKNVETVINDGKIVDFMKRNDDFFGFCAEMRS